MGSSAPQFSASALNEGRRANSEMNHLEFLQGRTELVSLPRRIVFELTNRCHFPCSPCGREGSEMPVSDLPMDIVRRFEGVLSYVEEVTLHGRGEGTLHPCFAEIMGFLNSISGLRKNFVTDGTTLERIHWVIFEHQVSTLTVLLDGLCPVTRQPMKGGPRKKFQALRKLLLQKEQRGAAFPHVHLVFTARRQNLKDLPDVLDRAAELGISEVSVEYLTVFSADLLRESLYNRQSLVREVFGEARGRAGRAGIRLNLPPIQGDDAAENAPHRRCSIPWRDLFIGSDGRIHPCRASSVDLGPAGGWESFYELWNSAPLQDFRRRVNDAVEMPECCAGCWHPWSANFNLPSAFYQVPCESPAVLAFPALPAGPQIVAPPAKTDFPGGAC